MPHVYCLEEAQPSTPTVIAVGVFDGVHIGHQALLRKLVARAHERRCTPAVLTFHPHPDKVLGRATGRFYLTTPSQRAALLEGLGVELIVTHPFDERVRRVRAAEFVQRLVRHLRVCELWVGADFALGYKREGNVGFLRAAGAQHGFSVRVVNLLVSDGNGDVVSSTGIRAALRAGDVERAARWLGRPYRLAGEVVHGDQRGRVIGFPTANLDVWAEQLLPANGVYAGWAHLGAETFMAVANVGNRPTFDHGVVTVEAHLLDFDRDIYGARLAFDVVARLRAERKFAGVDALIEQIRRDVARARAALERASARRA